MLPHSAEHRLVCLISFRHQVIYRLPIEQHAFKNGEAALARRVTMLDMRACASHEAIYQDWSFKVVGRCAATCRPACAPRIADTASAYTPAGKTSSFPRSGIGQHATEAVYRSLPDCWEGDLMLGLRSSAIGTLVEHMLRVTLLLHLPRRCAMHYADYLFASLCLSDRVRR